ncbi:MAG: DnaJ domain-containing protein, partial [Prochlorococcaceae cyanobacterium]
MADYYQLLGVDRDADADTLKRAYRRMARQYHPDVNKDPGAEEKFKEIGRAYEVLGDPQTRARYDQFGEAGVSGAAGGMPDSVLITSVRTGRMSAISNLFRHAQITGTIHQNPSEDD